MGDMIGGLALVFEIDFGMRNGLTTGPGQWSGPSHLRARGVDIIDTWGPGLFIAEPGAAYGEQLYGIEIGGGVIKPSTVNRTGKDMSKPMFHWNPNLRSYDKNDEIFSCWDEILIGGVHTNQDCPMEFSGKRKQREPSLFNLGTTSNYWELAERHVGLQLGNYAVLQAGTTFSRILGRTLKRHIIERWSQPPDLHDLDLPWGLQVSQCTGYVHFRGYISRQI